MSVYDNDNIFAKILRGESLCRKIHEDDYTLAFEDISPQAPVHALVIPKGKYISINDFAAHASDAEIGALIRAVAKVAQLKGVADPGFRLLSNIGVEGGQVVPHLHFHILGGAPLGAMLVKA